MGRKLKDGARVYEGGYRLAQHPKSGIWLCEHTESIPGQKSKSRSYSTRTANLAAAEEWLVTYRAGLKEIVTDSQHRHVTMATLIEGYRQDCRARGKEHGMHYRLASLEQFFGPYSVKDVDDRLCREYMKLRHAGRFGCGRSRKGALKSGSMKLELVALGSVFNHAVRAKTITLGDVPYIPKPAASPRRRTFLDTPEIEDMLARALALAPAEGAGRMPKITRFVWLALWTGSRAEALEKLTWDRVDFTRGLVTLHRDGDQDTAKRRAPIPIAPRLRPILERAWRERVDSYACGAGECQSQWRSFVNATPYAARGLTRHDLRRSFIIRMVSAGVPLAKVAQAVGDTVAVITKYYLHFAPNFLDDLWQNENAPQDKAA